MQSTWIVGGMAAVAAGIAIVGSGATADSHTPKAPTEYFMVNLRGEKEFENRINELMADGWQPQGGLEIACTGGLCTFGQAMVR